MLPCIEEASIIVFGDRFNLLFCLFYSLFSLL